MKLFRVVLFLDAQSPPSNVFWSLFVRRSGMFYLWNARSGDAAVPEILIRLPCGALL